MIFIDAIREASTEHEIYFLLTCYVEAIRYCDTLRHFPEPMRDLPIRGTSDLKTRMDALKFRFGEPSGMPDDRSFLIVKETFDIFGAALDRLYSLDGEVRHPLAEAA
jgi:hypothetical protein